MANGIKINGGLRTTNQAAKNVGGWTGTLFAGYLALAAAGVPMPTPAWSSDVEEVREDVVGIRIEILEGAIFDIDGYLYDINVSIQEFRDAGITPPGYVIDRLNTLNLQRKIKQVELEQLIRNQEDDDG